ncbi:MAG: sirohydrochlorin cobaltochelatase [Clostridiales bacterium]|nr:sirohydrochlorin cobaltochelatase [Clostridiales bacterium]
MKAAEKKAVLVVSFGTGYAATRKATIEAIERDIAAAFPGYFLYRAWASQMLLTKVRRREGLYIDSVPEAMERMHADGITQVIVQPTHVINGIENDRMKAGVLAGRDSFSSIRFGDPLLTRPADNRAVIRAVEEEFHSRLDEKTALVLMGHGTEHYANSIYAALDYQFKDMGYPNIFLGTVEAYPAMESLLRLVDACSPRKVLVVPFMIVAGEHARKDMAGEEADSWVNRLSGRGYQVEPVMKGLGEYKGIRDIFVSHAQNARPAENLL